MYRLGCEVFGSKTSIQDRVGKLLKTRGKVYGHDLLLMKDLIKWHPEQEMKEAVVNELFVMKSKYGNNHFVLNGRPFSYLKCIRRNSSKKNLRENIIKACRRAIVPDIDEFLRKKQHTNGMYRCEITGRMYTRDNVHVDHDYTKIMFSTILDKFIAKFGQPQIRSISKGGWELIDPWAFRNFHNEHAQLRIINKHDNVSAPKSHFVNL